MKDAGEPFLKGFTTRPSPNNSDKKRTRLAKVEADSKPYVDPRQTTDEKSWYVFDGDVRSEDYRMSTFARLARANPNGVLRFCILAIEGFFYTGVNNNVRCFCCGNTHENWLSSDDPLMQMSAWHTTDCGMSAGRDTDNIGRTERGVYSILNEWIRNHPTLYFQDLLQSDPDPLENITTEEKERQEVGGNLAENGLEDRSAAGHSPGEIVDGGKCEKPSTSSRGPGADRGGSRKRKRQPSKSDQSE